MTSQFRAVSTPLSSEIIQAFVCIQFLVPATAGNKRNALGWLDKEFKAPKSHLLNFFFTCVCKLAHKCERGPRHRCRSQKTCGDVGSLLPPCGSCLEISRDDVAHPSPPMSLSSRREWLYRQWRPRMKSGWGRPRSKQGSGLGSPGGRHDHPLSITEGGKDGGVLSTSPQRDFGLLFVQCPRQYLERTLSPLIPAFLQEQSFPKHANAFHLRLFSPCGARYLT